MCLAIPSRVLTVEGHSGIIESAGVTRKVSFLLLDDVRVGDFVLVHAGFAIHKMDRSTAESSLNLLKEALALAEGRPENS